MPVQSSKQEPRFPPSVEMVVSRFQFLSAWYERLDEHHHPLEVGLMRGDAEHVPLLPWPVFLQPVTSIHILIYVWHLSWKYCTWRQALGWFCNGTDEHEAVQLASISHISERIFSSEMKWFATELTHCCTEIISISWEHPYILICIQVKFLWLE